MKFLLYQCGCLKVIDKLVANGVKIDKITNDSTYETTAYAWDCVIQFDAM